MIVGSVGLQRGRALAVALVGLLVVVLAAGVPADGAPATSRSTGSTGAPLWGSPGPSGLVQVIVQKWWTADRGPELAVQRLGGRVTRALPIVAGFAATLPGGRAAAELARLPGVRAVTPDREVRVQATTTAAVGDQIRSVYPKVVRADDAWRNGVTGQGVTVAVVDTGIAQVPDLAGRVVQVTQGLGPPKPCKNLSGELNCDDAYGHGTFVAGAIAGNGASSGGRWKGVAPAAKVLSVKIAGANGAADVSNVLAAIQWVVSFKDDYGIRVLNLSLGTDSTQTYRTDPFNYAVERAWDAGIAVVVAASNRGPDPGTIAKPGDDPWVITVGATDDRGTTTLSDDLLPDFTGRGATAADGLPKPDVVAPGAHIVSLRAPGSTVDTTYPWYVDGSYRRGSGTSMATGVVSGAVALLLQANPAATPNRVKYALTATAREAASDDPLAVGAGVVDAYRASFSAPPGEANQGLDRSNGMGGIGGSRGSVQTQADDPLLTVLGSVFGVTLTAQLLLWNPGVYVNANWRPADWYLSTWALFRFYRLGWYGSDWPGSRWHGSTWYGQEQEETYGSTLPGSAWYGAWE
ncbi:MAG TPA: S8 family peptidase [Actinomycetota bacterium]|nr:S8 family peptidase [Actinomycetota bacterium]